MIKKQILDALGYTAFTGMQERFFEKSDKHNFIQLLAPTGSGKTLAFLTFLLERLKPDAKDVQAIIMVPGRELALQIESVFKQIKSGYKIVSCYGGHEFKKERQQLIEAPAVIVGTPGRVAQHVEEGSFNPRSIQILIIDEFDKALEQGFDDDMGFIIQHIGTLTFAVLTSATKLEEQAPYLNLKEYEILDELSNPYGVAERNLYKFSLMPVIQNGEHEFEARLKALRFILSTFPGESALVFCKTRAAVDELYIELNSFHFPVEKYHGAMEQRDREVAVFRFDNGSVNILVCTDLAARGLDINLVQHVIHFEDSLDEASFTHRNGRTGRLQQNRGNVYVFYRQDNELDKFKLPFEEFRILNSESLEQHLIHFKPITTKWDTLYFNLGKRDKIQKGDVLGFLTKDLKLKGQEVGKILIKDKNSYVAVDKSKVKLILNAAPSRKLKNKKFKVEVAK
ncbi:MAG: DEAD/DEAH box helicase [Pedobacter sp.]|nr:MAG: DEAD/DEAH box helicase [Pedobacter sp.]